MEAPNSIFQFGPGKTCFLFCDDSKDYSHGFVVEDSKVKEFMDNAIGKFPSGAITSYSENKQQLQRSLKGLYKHKRDHRIAWNRLLEDIVTSRSQWFEPTVEEGVMKQVSKVGPRNMSTENHSIKLFLQITSFDELSVAQKVGEVLYVTIVDAKELDLSQGFNLDGIECLFISASQQRRIAKHMPRDQLLHCKCIAACELLTDKNVMKKTDIKFTSEKLVELNYALHLLIATNSSSSFVAAKIHANGVAAKDNMSALYAIVKASSKDETFFFPALALAADMLPITEEEIDVINIGDVDPRIKFEDLIPLVKSLLLNAQKWKGRQGDCDAMLTKLNSMPIKYSTRRKTSAAIYQKIEFLVNGDNNVLLPEIKTVRFDSEEDVKRMATTTTALFMKSLISGNKKEELCGFTFTGSDGFDGYVLADDKIEETQSKGFTELVGEDWIVRTDPLHNKKGVQKIGFKKLLAGGATAGAVLAFLYGMDATTALSSVSSVVIASAFVFVHNNFNGIMKPVSNSSQQEQQKYYSFIGTREQIKSDAMLAYFDNHTEGNTTSIPEDEWPRAVVLIKLIASEIDTELVKLYSSMDTTKGDNVLKYSMDDFFKSDEAVAMASKYGFKYDEKNQQIIVSMSQEEGAPIITLTSPFPNPFSSSISEDPNLIFKPSSPPSITATSTSTTTASTSTTSNPTVSSTTQTNTSTTAIPTVSSIFTTSTIERLLKWNPSNFYSKEHGALDKELSMLGDRMTALQKGFKEMKDLNEAHIVKYSLDRWEQDYARCLLRICPNSQTK